MRKRERKPTKRMNFTKKQIEALRSPTAGRLTIYDTGTRCLGLRIEATGVKSFFWFRKVNGRPTFIAIGAYPGMSIDWARKKVAEYNVKLANWKADQWEGSNPFEQRRDLTVDELVKNYIERQIKPHAAHPERAAKDDEGWAKYFSNWNTRLIGAVRRKEVLDLHLRLKDESGAVTANRVVQFVRRIFNWAAKPEALAWTGENPAAGIKMFHEEPRTRFIQPDEMPRLFEALSSEPSLDLRDYVTLSLWTGARKSDVLSMRWENVSLADNRWEVPKPKNRKPYQVALTREAVDILGERHARNGTSLWVFPSRGQTGHIVSLKKPWRELLKRARVVNLTMHDLRRTFGAYQAANGASLQVIGKSLGHASIAATQRSYSPLNLDPVRESVAAATQAMLAASRKKPLLTALDNG